MANENAKKFEELLRSDEDLQAKLNETIDAYEGDRTNEQVFFDATIGKLAAEAGLPISYADAKEHSMQGVDLNDSELDAVAGGSACYIAGGGDTDNACMDDSGIGAGACRCLGVGFFGWS